MNGQPAPESILDFELIELESTKKQWTARMTALVDDNKKTDALVLGRKVKMLDIILEHYAETPQPVGEQQQLF